MEYNGDYTDPDNGVEYEVKSQGIKDSYTNGFAQQVYKLDDGTIVYVSYGQDRIQILTPKGEIKC